MDKGRFSVRKFYFGPPRTRWKDPKGLGAKYKSVITRSGPAGGEPTKAANHAGSQDKQRKRLNFSGDYPDPYGISKVQELAMKTKNFLTGCEPIRLVSTGVVYDTLD
jgi:hypothetical protein